MAHIELDPTRGDIAIQSEFREKDLVKTVPGTTWDKDEKIWRAPLSWASCIALRGVFGESLEVGPQLAEWSWEEFNTRVSPANDLRTALESAELMAAEPNLYPFQRAGVSYLKIAKQALIADEMGSGKTIQLIRTLVGLGDAFPALIIAPNSMKYTWKAEFAKWAPEVTVAVVDGSAKKRRDAIASGSDVVVINWEALRLHTRLESFGNKALTESEKEPKELNDVEWRAVIADEVHRAKDPNAKQTRALWHVSRGAEYRFGATGTPVANHPGDVWSIMNFVSPQDFPRKSKFVDRYCLLNFNPFGGMDIIGVKPEMQPEFNSIMDSRMIRRIKDVVLPYLPEKVYSSRVIPMGTKQAKAYNQMTEAMLAQIDGGLIDATNPLAQLTRLGQFACAYAEVNPEGDVKLAMPSNKIDALLDIVDELGEEQAVVFAESRQLIELAEQALQKAKVSFRSLHGNIPVEDRQENIEAFQAGEVQIMLVTLGAGGEGITLTAARVAVFLQRSWSLVKNKQAEDRIHRPGAEVHDSIEIIDLISAGTMEEYRLLKLAEKESRLQEVVRDDKLREMLTWSGDE